MIDREALAELPARLRDAATYGYMPARVRALLNEAADALTHVGEGAVPVGWVNGCDRTAPAALRFLADHDRPEGGEQRFNSAHLYQIAGEIEATAKKLAAAPHPPRQDGAREGLHPSPDIARGFPDGSIDLSTFDEIETALDAARAPCQIGERWLTLPERITALLTTPPAPDEAVEAEREAEDRLYIAVEAEAYRIFSDPDLSPQVRMGARMVRDAMRDRRARSRRDVGGGV